MVKKRVNRKIYSKNTHSLKKERQGKNRPNYSFGFLAGEYK